MTLLREEKEDIEPVWLSHDFDVLHQARVETEPLFGTGKLPLEGEVEDPPPFDQSRDEEANVGYGSIIKESKTDESLGSASKKPDSDWGSKNSDEKKKKKPVAGTPPKSIFDDPSDLDVTNDDSSLLVGKPHLPHRDYCLAFFKLVGAVTGLSSVALLATQLIPFVVTSLKSQSYFDMAIKVYVSLFCILFLLLECDAPVPFIQKSKLLQSYLSRGFLYSFLGLICLQEAYSERVKATVEVNKDEFHVAWASLFMAISAWMIFFCGVWYMIMGVFCLKRFRDKLRERDRQIWTKYRRDYKEWKRLN